jgi:hypothetical protein
MNRPVHQRLGRRPPSVVLIMRGFSIKLQKEELRSRSDRQVVPGGPRTSRQSESRVNSRANSRVPRGGNVSLTVLATIQMRKHSRGGSTKQRSPAAPPLRVTSM